MLEGASKADVRKHFQAWIESDEAKAEQQGHAGEIPYQLSIHTGGLSPRYFFCVHVDTESLNSVLNAATPPPELGQQGLGWVNMVAADWPVPDDPWEDRVHAATLYNLPEDPEDEGGEPIEGCRMENVGWMKVPAEDLAPTLYAIFQKPDLWDDYYTRPPAVLTSF